MRSPESVVDLLQRLIQVPSVNPEGGDPGVETTGEQACAELVGEILAHFGAKVELKDILPGRPNVIGVFPSDRPGKPRVYLAPHLDTVSVKGMTIDPFSGEVRDGKVWGRGASDTKGTMAAMLWALWELRDKIPTMDHEIWFVGLMGEETGQHGSIAFAKEYCAVNPERDFALIGEPTENAIVHTHKGATRLHIVAHGRAAHSAHPERGENAIYKIVEVIRRVTDDLIPQLAAFGNPVLGLPTASVGTIKGGSRINIVPDFCEMELDIRVTPELAKAKGGNVFEWAKGVVTAGISGLEITGTESHPLWTEPSHPLVTALQKSGGTLTGAPWFCDAASFAAVGVPAVAAGPGNIAQAHTEDEFISVEDLREGAAYYRRFLEQL